MWPLGTHPLGLVCWTGKQDYTSENIAHCLLQSLLCNAFLVIYCHLSQRSKLAARILACLVFLGLLCSETVEIHQNVSKSALQWVSEWWVSGEWVASECVYVWASKWVSEWVRISHSRHVWHPPCENHSLNFIQGCQVTCTRVPYLSLSPHTEWCLSVLQILECSRSMVDCSHSWWVSQWRDIVWLDLMKFAVS